MSRTEDDSWDITEGVGATALSVARARAVEADAECPLYLDPYAHFFVEAAIEAGWRSPFLDDNPVRAQAMASYIASRTKFFDEFFTTAGANGLDQAVILAAGLDGIENKRDPGRRLDINMYTDGHTVADVKRLPLNLLDALRAFDGSEVLRSSFGSFVPSYLKLKTEEWNSYARHLTAWERDNTLDC